MPGRSCLSGSTISSSNSKNIVLRFASILFFGRRSLSPKRGASHLEGPSFDELVLSFADAGELYVRYYPVGDAFVFGRTPKTVALPALWPAFDTSPSTSASNANISGAGPGGNRTAYAMSGL